MTDDARIAMIERLRLKLLAGAGQSAASALREALCQEPDRDLVRRLAEEARAALEEFLLDDDRD
ncbi:MAG: hypothetical protein ACK5WM_03115 [Rhodospirillales bacterium]|jgi:hypothetical protein